MVRHILRPQPVEGVADLPKGRKPIIRYFNPTIRLNETIISASGALVAKKGESVNPLDYAHFNEVLVFINGDHRKQTDWAMHLIEHDAITGKRVKVILVRGDIRASSNALRHRVYFDQWGKLCQHFHIKYTPTVVYQPDKSASGAQGVDCQGGAS